MKIKELLEANRLVVHDWLHSPQDKKNRAELKNKISRDSGELLKKLRADLKKADEEGDIDKAEEIEKHIKLVSAKNQFAGTHLS